MKLIEAVNISKTFNKGASLIEAIKKINFSIEKNEFVCIIGRSGSGKSTFLNILGCIDIPTEGKLFISGNEITDLSEQNLTKIRRENFGFIFQKLLLQDHLTAIENTALPLKYSGINEKESFSKAKEQLVSLGLENRLNFYPSELSGGECQRVAIARALVNNPKLILADEPTSELDTETSENIIKILKESAKNCSLIVVTHDAQILPFADRVLTITDGELATQ